ncbi:hypothetical protein CDAR_526991 [Caerostris darwini]|uniref:Uncharacterized protein n=1 Tax=Caerostris darwini TaxID=1538125 RepID=A0AAV4WKN2_9ARAC|nr:hypothetical protein CDAR_526991 [Caerostris darwini]
MPSFNVDAKANIESELTSPSESVCANICSKYCFGVPKPIDIFWKVGHKASGAINSERRWPQVIKMIALGKQHWIGPFYCFFFADSFSTTNRRLEGGAEVTTCRSMTNGVTPSDLTRGRLNEDPSLCDDDLLRVRLLW